MTTEGGTNFEEDDWYIYFWRSVDHSGIGTSGRGQSSPRPDSEGLCIGTGECRQSSPCPDSEGRTSIIRTKIA